MRKIIIPILLGLLLLPFASYSQDKVKATFFHSPHCKACLKLKKEFLPQIKEKYQGKVYWEDKNIAENKDDLALLISISQQFGQDQAYVPAVAIGNNFLVGLESITENLEKSIGYALLRKGGLDEFIQANDALIKVFNKLSVFTVMGSGLIDGLNPCAFAVIVFFISFLSVYGYRRREIIYIGTFYCLAVFITYLLIGLGFFKFLYAIDKFYIAVKVFYYLVGGFCFVLGLLAIWDYVKFKKTKSASDSLLQLPGFLKKKINLVIGAGLRDKKKSLLKLSVISFGVGFLVSLLEAVCTGQVYLPTIVFILKNTNLRLRATFYLLLYNLMFIVPLVVVFFLALLGVSSDKFNQFLKKHIGKIKILMAILFIALGTLIIWIN